MQENNKYIQRFKRILKWMLYSAVLLIITVFLLFRLSSVQTFVAQQTAEHFSNMADMDISIGSIDIHNFLSVGIKDLKVRDHHDSLFLTVKSINIDIIPSYLFEDKVFVKNVCIDSLFLALIEYQGEKELNIMKIVNSFISDNNDTSSLDIGIKAKEVCITNSYFALDLQNSEHFDGMDYTHLNVDNINILVHDFTIKGDSLIGNIKKLSAHEKCGFDLKSFVGNALVSPREIEIPDLKLYTNNSKIESDFNLRYKQWPDWLDFIEKVRFDSKVESIIINLDDIRYFATSLEGMDNVFSGKANVRGNIANIKITSADIKYANESYFKGKVSLNGLPDIEQTFIRIRVKDAYIDAKDISTFNIARDKKIDIPKIFDKYKYMKVNGRFTGFYYDFVSKASFNSALGRFSTDISLQPTENDKNFKYSGKLSTKNFKIQELIGTSYISDITMKASIKGVGLNENVDADYNIMIDNVTVSGFKYQDLGLQGKIANKRLETEFISNSDSFRLAVNGFYDFSDSLPHTSLHASLINARVNRFVMVSEDTLGHVSANIIADIHGNDIDNIQGYINIYDVEYSQNDRAFKTDSIITKSYLDNSFRELTIQGSNIDVNINGFRRFSDFPVMLDLLREDVFPNLTSLTKFSNHNAIEWSKEKNIADEQFNFDIKFLEINSMVSVFYPKFRISKDSEIKGSYTFSNDSLMLNVVSDRIIYDEFRASEIDMELHKDLSEVSIDLTSDYIRTAGGIYFDTLEVHGDLVMNKADFYISWGGAINTKNKGDIEGSFTWLDTNSFELEFTKGELYVHDSLWTLNSNSKIDYSYHSLEFSDFSITHADNSLSITGKATDDANDKIICNFKDVDISFTDFYLRRFDTDFDGFIDGKLEFSSLWLSPSFTGDIDIRSFMVNDFDLYHMRLHSKYSRFREAFILDAVIGSDTLGYRYVDFGGFYYPYKADNQLDLEVRLDKFPLQSLNEYLSSFTSNIIGEATGHLMLTGNVKKPILLGRLKTSIDDILIDYTNVHYSINDYFLFTPQYFGFVDAEAKDRDGNRLKLTTKINHSYFSDFYFDIDVKPINAEVLNTTAENNDLFYGKASGIGYFKLKGTPNDMSIDLNLKPINKSYIAIPISEQSSAEYSDFLTFVNKDTIVISREIEDIIIEDEEEEFAFSLDMTMDVDPSTTIELVMNEKVGDVISANGNGRIKIEYNNDGTYKMYGKYIIARGNYLFTMQSILNKRFIINPGSEIIWDGEMESAKINMKAIYRVDAKLYDIFQSVVDSANSVVYKKPSRVNCIINITGDLFDPTISFDINIPDESIADQELLNRLLSVESTGNSEEMNKNFVSLLILGSFQPPSGYESGANPNMLQHNATEILAEQVGNIMNQVSDDVEIGLEWNPGDEVTTQEIAVALSYTMLDDRLLLDGKFGQGGGSTDESSVRIVADMEIAYKLTPDGRIRAKVFNRTNYYDPLSRKAPYTQGVGISFRKDFNNLEQLLTKKDKVKKKSESKKEADKKQKVEEVEFEKSKTNEKPTSKEEGKKLKNENSEKETENTIPKADFVH